MAARGFTPQTLRPSFDSDPMHKAAARFADRLAILPPGKALINADYDVDGVTSALIMGQALKSAGWRVDVFIPSRFVDGYGINKATLEKGTTGDDRVNCIITLDCGATELDYLSDFGLKSGVPVFVVDHHKRTGTAKDNLCELNPQCHLTEGVQENGYCTAVLVAMAAFHLAKRFPAIAEKINDYLMIAGMGAIADVVSMKSVGSRALAIQFLEQGYHSIKNTAFRLYMRACGIKGAMTSADVGFKLVPPLNAVGRLDDATTVLAMFDVHDNIDAVERLIQKTLTLNRERRRLQDAIVNDACVFYGNDPALAAYSRDWHIGVVGPAAGRIAERYRIPVFLGGYSPDARTYSFSGRSGGPIDIHDLMTKVIKGLPVKMGGHKAALGFRIDEAYIEEVMPIIKERLDRLTPRISAPRQCDAIIRTVSMAHWQEIQALEPYGIENPAPLVCVPRVSVKLRRSRDRNDMASGTAMTTDGHTFDVLVFHNANIAATTRFTGDIIGSLICDRRTNEHVVKMIIEDFLPAA